MGQERWEQRHLPKALFPACDAPFLWLGTRDLNLEVLTHGNLAVPCKLPPGTLFGILFY